MANSDALVGRNASFAADGRHEGVPVVPRTQTCVVTCLDPRVDSAGFLGVAPGDAAVLRNAGGRVTPAVLEDLAYITFLFAAKLLPGERLFEIAVVHHTGCGTSFLADEGFRREYLPWSALDDEALAAEAITDPAATVRHDVELVRTYRSLSATGTVSGHVYDLDSGRVTTVVPATAIEPAGR